MWYSDVPATTGNEDHKKLKIFNQESRRSNVTSVYECGNTWSKSDFMSEKNIENALTGFTSIMKHYWGHEKHPVVLLADNLQQYQTFKVLEIAQENWILLQFLMPNYSHFLQPLDDKLFAIFKIELEKRSEEYDGSLSVLGKKSKNVLTSVIPSAFDVAFTPSHIQESWSNISIWLFCHDLIMEHAMLYMSKSQKGKYTQEGGITFCLFWRR